MEGKIGQIGFVITKSSWLSKTISWVLQSPYSHTFLVINETETVETGTDIVHIDSLIDHITNPDKICEIYEPIGLLESEKINIEANVREQLGTWYGYIKFIFSALQLMLRRIGIHITMSVHGTLCCDVPANAYVNTHFDEVKGNKKNTEELRQILINSPNWKLVFKKI